MAGAAGRSACTCEGAFTRWPRHDGGWQIVTMNLGDGDTLGLVGPVFIAFSAEGTGRLRCIADEGMLRADTAGPS